MSEEENEEEEKDTYPPECRCGGKGCMKCLMLEEKDFF